MMNAYELGQLEVHVDAFPGLMPLAYIEGKAEARNDLKKRRTKAGKTRPGYHWVDDPRSEKGGYWRKNRKSKVAALVSRGLATTALGAVGVAAIANTRRKNKQASEKISPLSQKQQIEQLKKGINPSILSNTEASKEQIQEEVNQLRWGILGVQEELRAIKNKGSKEKTDAYNLGAVEVRNDLKKRQRRSSGFGRKTKPGHHWVNDPSKKNGGYFRKNRGKKIAVLFSGGLAATAVTAEVVSLLRSRRAKVQPNKKQPKAKTLEDLEQEIVTEAEVKKAEQEIQKETQARKKKEEEERKKSEAALQKEVEKQMGKKSTIEQELEQLRQEQSERRTAEIGSKISKYTGQSDKRVPIIRNKSGDVDISATIESFGVGKPDTPVVDMNAVASSVREEVNNKVGGEYSQSLSKLTTGHNTSFGNIISRARNFAEPGFSEKNQERLVQRQIRTAMQISQFNKHYETAKQGLDKTVNKTLERLATSANEAQRTARSIDPEVMKTIQQGLDTGYMKGRFRDVSSSVKQLIPSALSKKTSTSMTEKEAREIIIEANKALKSIGKKELRYVYREEQNDSITPTLQESVVSFIKTLPSYRKVI